MKLSNSPKAGSNAQSIFLTTEFSPYLNGWYSPDRENTVKVLSGL